ncbi:type II toxin-antitoxin system RelE/ParE family toxin [Thiorhodovibrio frisius]|uniref:Putative addiction module killer protein n=1 Tax=Thiorhodovibrio frisius TaxID=631362 RepID=H8Z3Z0_9GAMM|nr:type II toxin-antitoxin system RelE/ParE family toxin [Thiorhodovibrio frisius]EIC21142.1 putative addiction module killer protein [Thiorhodovibrio frisius]WPL22202.1 putative addiction module killer protein [Thiorhodovibrio frisius]
MSIEIREYVTLRGKSPFGDWLEKLRDQQAKANILTRLDRLQMGHFGDTKHLRAGVHELRIHQGKGYRVYYGRVDDVIVLLLCGGEKASQTQDIDQAVRYWQAYRQEIGEK